jgi:prepilin-type N-terminal cleavage/methylation domain-containing protein
MLNILMLSLDLEEIEEIKFCRHVADTAVNKEIGICMSRLFQRDDNGFSLMEVSVVVLLMGLLVGLSYPGLISSTLGKSALTRTKNISSQLEMAFQEYSAANPMLAPSATTPTSIANLTKYTELDPNADTLSITEGGTTWSFECNSAGVSCYMYPDGSVLIPLAYTALTITGSPLTVSAAATTSIAIAATPPLEPTIATITSTNNDWGNATTNSNFDPNYGPVMTYLYDPDGTGPLQPVILRFVYDTGQITTQDAYDGTTGNDPQYAVSWTQIGL